MRLRGLQKYIFIIFGTGEGAGFFYGFLGEGGGCRGGGGGKTGTHGGC